MFTIFVLYDLRCMIYVVWC